tara:strand:- start:1455 stop:1901 length:447 start_codon:yes stop_codon:yes gene_type:complete
MSDEKRDYDVGYGKPPVHGRFKPGQSGNPKGRPKGAKNLKTDLSEELAERIQIREGGKSLKISKQRAVLKALVSKALGGDPRSATILIGLIAKLIEPDDSPQAEETLGPDDLEIIEAFLKRRLNPSQQTNRNSGGPVRPGSAEGVNND